MPSSNFLLLLFSSESDGVAWLAATCTPILALLASLSGGVKSSCSTSVLIGTSHLSEPSPEEFLPTCGPAQNKNNWGDRKTTSYQRFYEEIILYLMAFCSGRHQLCAHLHKTVYTVPSLFSDLLQHFLYLQTNQISAAHIPQSSYCSLHGLWCWLFVAAWLHGQVHSEFVQ